MPILPRVEPTQVQVGVPRGPRENAFTEIGDLLGKGLGLYSQVAQETEKRNDAIWISQAKKDYLLRLEKEKENAATAEADPIKRLDLYSKAQTQAQQDFAKQAPTPAAREAIQTHFNDLATTDFINYRHAQFKQVADTQMAALPDLRQTYADLVTSTTDPHQQSDYYRTYEGASQVLATGAHPAQTQVEHQKGMAAFNEAIGQSYINNQDYDGYTKYTDSQQFRSLSSDVQGRLDARVDQAMTRQGRVSKALQEQQIDAAIYQNPNVMQAMEQGKSLEDIWKQITPDLKNAGLWNYQARHALDEMSKSFKGTKGKDSPEYHDIMEGLEEDISKSSNGLPSGAQIRKWNTLIDKSPMDNETKAAAHHIVNGYAREGTRFALAQQGRDDKAVQQSIKKGQDELKAALLGDDIWNKVKSNPDARLGYQELQQLDASKKRFTEIDSSLRAKAETSPDPYKVYHDYAEQLRGGRAKVKETQSFLQNTPGAQDMLNDIKGKKPNANPAK